MAALALEFLILTAARTGEVLGATWDEVSFDDRLWTIPNVRTKSGREHRVPLSDSALAILAKLAELEPGGFVFPGQLSVVSMEMVMKRRNIAKATPHDFRNSFSNWAAEATMFQSDVIEGCLAHVVGSAVTRAYRRSNVLEKRRAVLGAAFCETGSR
jgi:integrase